MSDNCDKCARLAHDLGIAWDAVDLLLRQRKKTRKRSDGGTFVGYGDSVHKEVVALARTGELTLAGICRKVHIGRHTASRILVDNGLNPSAIKTPRPPPPKPNLQRGRPSIITDALAEEILSATRRGESRRSIAHRLSLPLGPVDHFLQKEKAKDQSLADIIRANVRRAATINKVNIAKLPPPGSAVINHDTIKQATELLATGLTMAKVAHRVGVRVPDLRKAIGRIAA